MWYRFDVRIDCREAKRVDRKEILIAADFRMSREQESKGLISYRVG